MTLDKIIVTVFGLLGIAFTYWFFLGKKEKEAIEVSDSVDITVDGGYSPQVISIPRGKTTTLNFIRRDPTNCLEELVIPNFRIRKYLPLKRKVAVEVTPTESGEFEYACGMNMFKGKIVVK